MPEEEIKPRIFNRTLSWDGVSVIIAFGSWLLWMGWYSSKVDSTLQLHTRQIESILITQGEIQKTQSETSSQIAALLQAEFDRNNYSKKSAGGTPRAQDN